MLKKLKLKFICINMTIVTCMLVFILFTVIRMTERNIGRIHLQIAEQKAAANFLEHLTRTCFIIGLISFLVFLGISIFFANWAVKPVDRAWTRQKQFIADASHELKTPLTIILTNTELLLNDVRKPSSFSNTGEHLLENILVVAKQMKTLIEGMLELSRVDNGSVKLDMKSFDFSELLEQEVCMFEPLYFENGRSLNTDISPQVMVNGSESYLRQLIEILLDNALKYSTAGTAVNVHLQKHGRSCLLSVTSQGSPLSPVERKDIFKRFYRTDKSRTSDGSYGLGLAIAEGIVQEHHGKIWAESNDGVNSFYVQV